MKPLVVVLSENENDWVAVVCKAHKFAEKNATAEAIRGAGISFCAWNCDRDGAPSNISTLSKHDSIDIVFSPSGKDPSLESLVKRAREAGREILVAYHSSDSPGWPPEPLVKRYFNHSDNRCWNLLKDVVAAIEMGADGRVQFQRLCVDLSQIADRYRKDAVDFLVFALRPLPELGDADPDGIQDYDYESQDAGTIMSIFELRIEDLRKLSPIVEQEIKSLTIHAKAVAEAKFTTEHEFIAALTKLRDMLFSLLDELRKNEAASFASHA